MTIVKQQINLKIPTKFKKGQKKPCILYARTGNGYVYNGAYWNNKMFVQVKSYSQAKKNFNTYQSKFSIAAMQKYPKICSLFWMEFANSILILEPKMKIIS